MRSLSRRRLSRRPTRTERVARAVGAPFAAVRRAAARPRVRDLRPGDVVSRPYGQLHEAHFRTVARVLVRTDRPTRFAPVNRPGRPRRPVGFMAAIDYDDGGRDVVTTDAVYARRGAHIDPSPTSNAPSRAQGHETASGVAEFERTVRSPV